MSTNRLHTLNWLDPNPAGGPAVVLLHGLGADCTSWDFQMEALTGAGLRPLAFDLPGFGRSQIPAGAAWTVKTAAETLAAALDELVNGPVHLVGLSMGGVVALQFALDFPTRVDHLVLVNTFAALRPKRWDELVYFLGRFTAASLGNREGQARSVARRVFPYPEQAQLRDMLVGKILEADPAVYRAAMIQLGTFNVRKRLKEINRPTLMISGEKDTTVPLDNQADLVRYISGSRQVIIPGAGHGVTIDHPQEFNRELLAFLCAA